MKPIWLYYNKMIEIEQLHSQQNVDNISRFTVYVSCVHIHIKIVNIITLVAMYSYVSINDSRFNDVARM